MTTTSGPGQPGPAPAAPAFETPQDKAAATMAALTRPLVIMSGLPGIAVQLAGPALMTAASAGLLLAAEPGAWPKAAAAACLALILARVLFPAASSVIAARRPDPPWTSAATFLQAGHPAVLPAGTLDAARRRVPQIAAARRQERAWLYVPPCTGTCTVLCVSAGVMPFHGRALVILGAHPAADPVTADVLLAHEAAHHRPAIRAVLTACQSARAARGWGWAAAGAAGAAIGGWPAVLAAAAITHVVSLAGLWAAEIACDRAAAREEGHGAAARAWDHGAAALASLPARPGRAVLTVLAWAAGPAHPPLALRRALTARTARPA